MRRCGKLYSKLLALVIQASGVIRELGHVVCGTTKLVYLATIVKRTDCTFNNSKQHVWLHSCATYV